MKLDVGQLFAFGFNGTKVDAATVSLIEKNNAFGVCLFKRNIESLEQVVELNKELLSLNTNFPPMISVDQEGGRVARLAGICTDIPPMKTIGQYSKNDLQKIYRLAALMARELVALGFHLNFAPVADVDSNPQNPIIGDRSFDSDFQHVASCVDYFVRGMQDSGIASCAKHFPGHGDTDKDSHLELPIMNAKIDVLTTREFVPFESAIKSNVACIMTAHILVIALDSKLPATLSPHIIDAILRKQMGYEGVVISDDLDMKGIADGYDIGEIIEYGVNAGIDLFLICNNVEKCAQAIELTHSLLASGKISKARLEQSIFRVQKMKTRYMGMLALPDIDYARTIVKSEPHLNFINQLA